MLYFYSLPCLVGNFPLIKQRTQEKNCSIAFNMYIFLFIHACDAFSFVSVSRISHTKVRVNRKQSLIKNVLRLAVLLELIFM